MCCIGMGCKHTAPQNKTNGDQRNFKVSTDECNHWNKHSHTKLHYLNRTWNHLGCVAKKFIEIKPCTRRCDVGQHDSLRWPDNVWSSRSFTLKLGQQTLWNHIAREQDIVVNGHRYGSLDTWKCSVYVDNVSSDYTWTKTPSMSQHNSLNEILSPMCKKILRDPRRHQFPVG